MNKKNAIQSLIYIISLHIISSFLYHGHLVILLEWISKKPLLFLFNLFILVGISLVAIALINLKYGIILVSISTTILSFISYKKYTMRTSRLIMSDVMQINEILAISEHVSIINPIIIIVSIINIFLFSYIAFRLIGNTKVKQGHRFSFLLLGIFITVSINFIPINYAVDNKGLFLDLVKNNSKVIYSQNTEEPQFQDFEEYQDFKVDSTKDQPNIIIIMNESYWDIRKLKDVKYNKNLYRTFDLMSKNGVSGFLESPEFGGGTSNVEFELLTGHSAHFFPPGYVFYNEEKDREFISSLPDYFKNLSYETTAIHSYKSWFYNRENIYKSMSFDNFISSEDMIKAKKKGFYISDETVTDYIIDTLDTHEKPQFIFAITMQNHGPFNDARYDEEQEVKLLNGSSDKRILETYGQGIYDADQALEKLYNHVNMSDEKTMVVFFGDHLPVLGDNLKVYKEENFVDNNTELKNKVKLSSVPFFIWSNFHDKKEKIKLLNISYLGAYILDYLDINNDPYFRALSDLTEKLPVISRAYGIDENHELIDIKEKKYIKYQEHYRKLQFSVLQNDLSKKKE